MTTGETIIYKTIKDNFNVLASNGVLRIEWSKIDRKKEFKEALLSLQKARLINYEISFMSVMISLTPKGSMTILNDKDFDHQ